MRKLLVLPAAALLLAACGSQTHRAAPTTSAAPRPSPAQPADVPVHRLRRVQVTVLDADTKHRVAGALVRIGRRAAISDRHGVAHVPLAHRAALVTTASAPGYDPHTVRLPFRTHPKSTIRIWKRSLQWTMYGADLSRTQAQDALRVRPPFRITWSKGLGALIEFPAVVSDGVAYVVNANDSVFALSMANGATIWRHDVPYGKSAASPAVVGDELVVHGMDGHVWVYDRTDGRVLWHYTTGSPIESSPVVVGGIDVFGDWAGTITALDLQTHRVRWTRYDGCKITSSAAYAAGTLYIGDYCGRLLALDARTGALRWSGGVNGRIYGTPAVAGGRVFVPSSDGGSLTAFSVSGRELWRRDVGSYVYSSPAVWGGRVFFGSYAGVFYCVSASTGATLWTAGAGGAISGAPSVVDGIAYAGSFAHHIVGVDARSGRVVVDFPHGEYVPVSGAGNTLLLHGYSRLYAVVAK